MAAQECRIFYWNMKNLTIKKFTKGDNELNSSYAEQRWNYFRNAINDADPQVIVLVEVDANSGTTINDGTLLSNVNSEKAIDKIYQWLLARNQKSWCLVPPLNSGDGGKREVIAIYYRSDFLAFTGPDLWSQAGVPMQAGKKGTVANYDPEWAKYLPSGKLPVIAENSKFPYNQGRDIASLSGRMKFTSTDGNPLYFPDTPWINMNCAPDRSPFLVTFNFITIPQTYLKLIALHFSPKNAKSALTNFSRLSDLYTNNANEVIVIVGDFNVDVFSERNWETKKAKLPCGYCNFASPEEFGQYKIYPNPFEKLLDGSHGIDFKKRQYSMTHYQITSRNEALENNKSQLAIYANSYSDSFPTGNTVTNEKFGLENMTVPGDNSAVRGYMGVAVSHYESGGFANDIPSRNSPSISRNSKKISMAGSGGRKNKSNKSSNETPWLFNPSYTSAIDAFFVKCNNKVGIEVDASVKVMNYVVGMSYSNDGGPSVAQTKTAMFGPDAGNIVNDIRSGNAITYGDDDKKGFKTVRTFNDASNFGHVQKTSDHLPLTLQLTITPTGTGT